MNNAATSEIDAIGLLCPLPVLKLQKALRALKPGQQVTLLATDPASRIDVPHFCAQSGHRVIETSQDNETLIYVVECGVPSEG